MISVVLIVMATLVGGVLFQTTQAQSGFADAGRNWLIKADRPIVIGGYGDNFDWTGNTIRPLKGFATLDIDLEAKRGSIEATFSTTQASGPLHFSSSVTNENGINIVENEYLEGQIRLVFHIDSQTRLVENTWLHGDTGNEAPVLPDVFNFLAGWPEADLYVNGQLAYESLAGHFMFAEQLRREDGSVRNEAGELYTIGASDKSRFTIPGQWELHLMVMSMDSPDANNFPPFSKVLHVNFENLFIADTPTGTSVPQF